MTSKMLEFAFTILLVSSTCADPSLRDPSGTKASGDESMVDKIGKAPVNWQKPLRAHVVSPSRPSSLAQLKQAREQQGRGSRRSHTIPGRRTKAKAEIPIPARIKTLWGPSAVECRCLHTGSIHAYAHFRPCERVYAHRP